jgi:uncharacterized protein (TIGR02284 family)
MSDPKERTMQRQPSPAEATTGASAELQTTLEGLVAVNLGSADLLNRSAGAVTDPLYGEMLERYATQHRQFAEELGAITAHATDQFPPAETISSSLPRALAELLSGSTNDTGVLADCDTQEEAAVQRYYEALQQTLPADLEPVVREQFAEIKGAHTHIRRMYEALTQAQERLETTT